MSLSTNNKNNNKVTGDKNKSVASATVATPTVDKVKTLPNIKDLETELMTKKPNITPDDILKLNKYTKSKLLLTINMLLIFQYFRLFM
jgi:hypothetical protein